MAEIKDIDAISSDENSEGGIQTTKAVDEKAFPPGPPRNKPARPTGNRRVSEWEAIQIAAAGDLDTIDREVAEVEADLQQMNIHSTWLKPQLRLKDPRHFTWLLVGQFLEEYSFDFLLTRFRLCFYGWSTLRY
jgi:hypothetical protein